MQIKKRVYNIIIGAILLLQSTLSFANNLHESNSVTPYLFEENKGQFHENVLYRCRLPMGYLFLEKNGLTYLFENQKDKAELMQQLHLHNFIGPQPQIIQLQIH